MKYCARCLMPETKPHSVFHEDGICGACHSHDLKTRIENQIDWRARAEEFENLVEQARERRAPLYDVLIPVSGGKDSITQVDKLLCRGLRILAVNVDYGIKTEIGLRNLKVINKMGANLIVYTPEPSLHWKLIRLGFEEYGDPDLMSHTLLHGYPLHVAKRFEIPLVLLGENSAFEYSGDQVIGASGTMTRDWFDKYAANDGKNIHFVSSTFNIPIERLRTYDMPDDLEASGVTATFMSHYFPWDSERHLDIARKHGFETLPGPSEGTYRNYVGIDEKINRIHQYLKVLKFGYGRATDHACEDIRNGRLSREEAKRLVEEHDLKPLSSSYTNEFIELCGMTKEHFTATLEKYRNLDIWRKVGDGKWVIPDHLDD